MRYDCFSFFNELDILELRLETLKDVVDKFVLAESTVTFTNQRKTLAYRDNMARFERFHDRIIHVVVEDNPTSEDPWTRERYQRNCVIRGLGGCRDDDLILISDVDEIPDPLQLAALRPPNVQLVFEQKNCNYYLNYCHGFWHGTRLVPFHALKSRTASAIRLSAGKIISNGGWHFTYHGGVGQIQRKLRAFAHQEYNHAAINDPDWIQAALATGKDILGRSDVKTRVLSLDELPDPIRKDPKRYAHLMGPEIVSEAEFLEQRNDQAEIRSLTQAFERVRGVDGRVIQIGCREGRSTAALAKASWPTAVHAIWPDKLGEAANHDATETGGDADRYQRFLRNMLMLTSGNFAPHRQRPDEFLSSCSEPIKFCHFDGEPPYEIAKREIELALQHVAAGGIICGSDFRSAPPGMNGGTERAVREVIPDFQNDGGFWYWQKPPRTAAMSWTRRKLAGIRAALRPIQIKQIVAGSFAAFAPGLASRLQAYWWAKQARKRMWQRDAEEKVRQAKTQSVNASDPQA